MYGVSEELGFSPFGLSLLNRGFIYAIAHVRGGGEFPSWHKESMLLKKKNHFTDYPREEELRRLPAKGWAALIRKPHIGLRSAALIRKPH